MQDHVGAALVPVRATSGNCARPRRSSCRGGRAACRPPGTVTRGRTARSSARRRRRAGSWRERVQLAIAQHQLAARRDHEAGPGSAGRELRDRFERAGDVGAELAREAADAVGPGRMDPRPRSMSKRHAHRPALERELGQQVELAAGRRRAGAAAPRCGRSWRRSAPGRSPVRRRSSSGARAAMAVTVYFTSLPLACGVRDRRAGRFPARVGPGAAPRSSTISGRAVSSQR